MGLTSSSQEATPWPEQQPYLTEGFSAARNLLRAGMPDYYPGETVAPFTPAQSQAQNAMLQYAGGPVSQGLMTGAANQMRGTWDYGRGLMDQGLTAARPGMSQAGYAGYTPFTGGQLSSLLAGDVNVSQLAPVVGAMSRDIMGELSAPGGMLSQIRGQQVQYQPGGSSRGDMMAGMAGQAASQRLIDTASRMYSDAYGQAQNRRLGAAQMAQQGTQAAQQLGLAGGQLGLSALGQYPGVMQAPLSMYSTVANVGAQRRAMDQARINADMQRYNYAQMKPYQALAAYMPMISGDYGGKAVSKPSGVQTMGNLANIIMGITGALA